MRPSGNHSPLDRRSILEDTIGIYLEESSKRQDNFKRVDERFRESTDKNLKRHDLAINGLEKKVEQLAQAVYATMTNDSKSVSQVKIVAIVNSPNTHCSNSHDFNNVLCTSVVSNLTEQENVMKAGKSSETPKTTPVISTFADKVKRRIAEEQERMFLESLEKVQVNTPMINTIRQTRDYMKSLQELVSKKTRMAEVSIVKLNARCLGNPKHVRMVIEMADKSLQSPKGIIENVLVKIDRFIFPVDFVILDIVEDDKVLIILGRPMLATAHARIDVFGKKNLLDVGGEKVMFNANEGISPLPVTSVYAMNNFQVPNGFGEQEHLEEFLMNNVVNADLGDFLELDDLFPENGVEPFGIPLYSESNMGIGLEDFGGNLEDLLDEQTPQIRQNEDVNEFIKKGLTKILLGRPFKESIGLEENVIEGLVWFKNEDDKTIFQMPRTISRFCHLSTKQCNMMAPVLRVSDEDKAIGFNHPYQKINVFYKGCMQLGNDYKRVEKVSTAKGKKNDLASDNG
ncbi:homeodomain-like protein [Tanacetum coccineum]